ncbi:shikimate kinase [Streptosporangium becharense]|uniref:Shikimate kinase n=1 Tax=Streptosporangium becharense TaxID=1816182 RepID=A0A7W9IJ13_9ACTN|nr:shikimate kinase [Streptosporangium becharense]MBB2911332.1 shikimate kinase [Streptosporangium becharense]MBB5821610.1 shikimate kinase [Streptosporangium becharense]
MEYDRPIVVTGLMGSGKSSVGRLLAEELGRELRDSDPDIAARYGGATAAETVASEGAGVLHAREASHLRESLAERPPVVVAAAASVVDDPESRAAMGPALVVWLDAPPAVLAERMRSGAHRPHFEPDLEAMLTKQRTRRGPLFAEVADLTFDVSSTSPEEVAAAVLSSLDER